MCIPKMFSNDPANVEEVSVEEFDAIALAIQQAEEVWESRRSSRPKWENENDNSCSLEDETGHTQSECYFFTTQDSNSASNSLPYDNTPNPVRGTDGVDAECSLGLNVEEKGDQGVREPFLALDRASLYRPKGVFVTDITSSEWCQVQVAFKLHEPGTVVKTSEMLSGLDRHAELEAETQETIEIEAETEEDGLAVRMLSTHAGLKMLLTNGITRELPVFGRVCGIWIWGVVDDVRLCRSEKKIEIRELKTRGRNCPPSLAQQRTAELQVMLYERLLRGLTEATTASIINDMCSVRGLRMERELSAGVRQYGKEIGVSALNLADVLGALRTACEDLSGIAFEGRVVYEWQRDNSVIMERQVEFDEAWVNERLNAHLDVWKGKSSPVRVPEEEAWKCRFCDFSDACLGCMDW